MGSTIARPIDTKYLDTRVCVLVSVWKCLSFFISLICLSLSLSLTHSPPPPLRISLSCLDVCECVCVLLYAYLNNFSVYLCRCLAVCLSVTLSVCACHVVCMCLSVFACNCKKNSSIIDAPILIELLVNDRFLHWLRTN